LRGGRSLQLDENHCPLCGGENLCLAGTEQQNSCWCMKVKVSKEILEFVPKEIKGKYCICQNCIEDYKE